MCSSLCTRLHSFNNTFVLLTFESFVIQLFSIQLPNLVHIGYYLLRITSAAVAINPEYTHFHLASRIRRIMCVVCSKTMERREKNAMRLQYASGRAACAIRCEMRSEHSAFAIVIALFEHRLGTRVNMSQWLMYATPFLHAPRMHNVTQVY